MRLSSTICLILLLGLFGPLSGAAQQSEVRLSWPLNSDTLHLDTASVLLHTLRLERTGVILPTSQYTVQSFPLAIVLKSGESRLGLQVYYRRIPAGLGGRFALRDSSEIIPGIRDFSAFNPSVAPPPPAFGTGIKKSGSLSRGVAFGNAQNLSVNSNLNLQLSGRVTDKVRILASITDNSIPIQPQGNTQQLQDFDQVFIQLYDANQKLIAGDFQVIQKQDHFLKFNKRAQGLTFSGAYKEGKQPWRVQASAALSKGKFSRNQIQGLEGNQGPYRLTGPAGEAFIIVLAGTERVYIDGKLLERGQDQDYTIDYNTAEITFTPRNLITKDRRIIVEFQFSDRNYARSVFQGEALTGDSLKQVFIRWYAETDARNQPLRQELTLADRDVLAAAGDNALDAVVLGIDSVGWSDNAVRYALRDSLGYEGILVLTTHVDSGHYSAVFSEVGSGNGDYIEDGFVAAGRVFRWLAPDTLDGNVIHNGNYAPLQLLARPERRRMLTLGGRSPLGRRFEVFGQGAVSSFDQNTFSDLDQTDDPGSAALAGIRYARPANDSLPWRWDVEVRGELVTPHFSAVERFRAVEFWRNWNILGVELTGQQELLEARIKTSRKNGDRFGVGFSHLNYGEFSGDKGAVDVMWKPEKGLVQYKASALQASFLDESRFARHKTHINRAFGAMRLGYRDEWEWNERRDAEVLLPTSYRFHDAQVYLATADSSAARLELYYRTRIDKLSDSTRFVQANVAEHTGLRLNLGKTPRHQLHLDVSNRILRITNTEISKSEPENTLLGRVQHRFSSVSGVLRSDLFYETGSGLEQQREFVYLEVPAGQGVYVWNDYNDDGVKDLGEFEIAAFAYEANYIRTFVPGTSYLKTFATTLTYSVTLQPDRSAKLRESAFRWLKRFSAQASTKFRNKTTHADGWERFNPLSLEVADTSLVSTESASRGTVFFNRSNPRFGAQFSARDVRNKTLLANGFESRDLLRFEGELRVLIKSAFTLRIKGLGGNDNSAADYTLGRNYNIALLEAKPELTWQPGTTYRMTADFRYAEKANSAELGGETALIRSVALAFKWTSIERGSVEGRVSIVDIDASATDQNALAFALLEGLSPGRNGTWNFNIRQNVARNLQLTLRYDGRISEGKAAIHSGGMQLRAFF